jgi:hypothetical protein
MRYAIALGIVLLAVTILCAQTPAQVKKAQRDAAKAARDAAKAQAKAKAKEPVDRLYRTVNDQLTHQRFQQSRQAATTPAGPRPILHLHNQVSQPAGGGGRLTIYNRPVVAPILPTPANIARPAPAEPAPPPLSETLPLAIPFTPFLFGGSHA